MDWSALPREALYLVGLALALGLILGALPTFVGKMREALAQKSGPPRGEAVGAMNQKLDYIDAMGRESARIATDTSALVKAISEFQLGGLRELLEKQTANFGELMELERHQTSALSRQTAALAEQTKALQALGEVFNGFRCPISGLSPGDWPDQQ